jgi:hypothetical protein
MRSTRPGARAIRARSSGRAKSWRSQIERVLANTAGMYGEVRGMVGSSVPRVPALELDAVAGKVEDMTGEVVG